MEEEDIEVWCCTKEHASPDYILGTHALLLIMRMVPKFLLHSQKLSVTSVSHNYKNLVL